MRPGECFPIVQMADIAVSSCPWVTILATLELCYVFTSSEDLSLADMGATINANHTHM